ncbi:hypothetical protein FRC07_010395 [Ceratobasidium sp. 392]|nr:hypothetical protein FRC07_010395 [Ceratobasidium sp. 392]
MRVLLLGASRHIGYFVAQRLLSQGHTCTLLLRHPEAIESDASMSPYIKDGKLTIVPGDGLVEADVQEAWDKAKGDGEVDAIYFGIGGEPSFSLLKFGFIITPADLTARSMSILLSIIQSSTIPSTRPKLLTVTTNGLDAQSRSALPYILQIIYAWLPRIPFADKLQQEIIVKRAAGWDGGEGWLGSNNVVIVRPSMLADGECLADKNADAYRTGEELRSP